MKIVFMGTPDYAVATLEALIKEGHCVEAVFAQPDKPVGRKQILTPPPVKICAKKYNIPVFQPSTLKDGEAFKILKEINPDVIVVVPSRHDAAPFRSAETRAAQGIPIHRKGRRVGKKPQCQYLRQFFRFGKRRNTHGYTGSEAAV